MGYTSIYGKRTAEHIESDTWHNTKGQEIRLHHFKCRACGKTYMYSSELYERCPFCAMPILHYRRAS